MQHSHVCTNQMSVRILSSRACRRATVKWKILCNSQTFARLLWLLVALLGCQFKQDNTHKQRQVVAVVKRSSLHCQSVRPKSQHAGQAIFRMLQQPVSVPQHAYGCVCKVKTKMLPPTCHAFSCCNV